MQGLAEDPIMQSISGSSSTDYPVCVEMEVVQNRLIWRTICDGRHIGREDVPLLLHQLDVVLGFIVEHSSEDVFSFSGREISICGLPPVILKPSNDVRFPGIDEAAAEYRSDDAWSDLEETIRGVLARVSGAPVMSILKTHSIYHLGLDSISAVKVSSLLRELGIRIAFRDMLRAKSISEIAETARMMGPAGESDGIDNTTPGPHSRKFVLDDALRVPDILEGAGIDTGLVEDVFPATAMQVHMISVWQNTRERMFFPDFKFRLTGNITLSAVVLAWEMLVAEMPILRTAFVSTGSRDVPILQVVLRPEGNCQKPASPHAGTYGVHLRQPQASLSVMLESREKWVLCFRIHHALYDAVSLPIILNRFGELCLGDTEQRVWADNLPRWRELVSVSRGSARRATAKKFWTTYLGGALTLSPPLNPQQTRVTRVRAKRSLNDSSSITDISTIKLICSANGVSIQAIFFAAYATFLASSYARTDIVFGIYLANRGDTVGYDALPYPTLCLVPLRVRVTTGQSLVEMAAHIQQDIHAISSPANVGVVLWEV